MDAAPVSSPLHPVPPVRSGASLPPAEGRASSGSHSPAAGATAPGPLWDGAVNARDVGAAVSAVQPGRLYRMGRHEWVTEAGWEQAWEHGARTVIDLRNPFELGRRSQDPRVRPDVLARFTVLNLPTEDQTDADFMALTGPYLNTPEHYRENLYRWPEKFGAIARAFVTAPPGGVVIHCAAGRDRTGMVVALLLAASGIPHPEIGADYARAVTAINDRYRGQEVPHETPRSHEELAEWLAVAQGHLGTLLSSLDAARYLLDAGLTEAELDLLRERLTGSRAPVQA
ncbi:tyrosine-protein phosphatase [Arthrobacter bussei]|uniref:Tyrosine-protein phosphatase n=1 Tax=Arthrobacter bussei TaxID=2594179 RepID=A0A7X1NND2_9MICC|nr:tyrosine-protein phosphatase [Arthrobacter bussei]MPY10051.1 tyrosine-protein phosphatase [Arthrobacter bussei]